MRGPTSPVGNPDNRFHAPTIAEVDAKLTAEGYATGLKVWANVEDAYIEAYLCGDGNLGDAQLASLDAAIRSDALTRIHDKVREQMAASSQAGRDAAQEGRDSDAATNAAQADALDWVLQRIDEELNQ